MLKSIYMYTFFLLAISSLPTFAQKYIWTAIDGREIALELDSFDTRQITFRKKNGRKVSIPLTKLSEASQQQIKNLTENKKRLKMPSPSSRADFSKLWGKYGEEWNPTGRLPDFSFAGYHYGEIPLPTIAAATNVVDFGAKPNDGEDDSLAFQKAVDAIDSGAIEIPEGRFVLTNFVYIKKDGIVLRGAGEDKTTLYMPLPAEKIAGKRDGGFASAAKGQIISIEPPHRKTDLLTEITGPSKRGTYQVTVNDASMINPGDYVMLRVEDEIGEKEYTGPFWNHLHANKIDWLGYLPEWAEANASWPFLVSAAEDDTITFYEPLRFDLSPEWKATLLERNAIAECGVEYLRMEFPSDVPTPPHLQEPGYNGVRFQNAVHCWIRNVTFSNSDNPITAYYGCSGITMLDITFEGRRGHHGISLSGSANCLIEGLTDNCKEPWIHTVTMDHKSCGNVHKGTKGNNVISLDFHRDIPFENLHTDIQSECNFNSSGAVDAGPHAGARNVYWGLSTPSNGARNQSAPRSDISDYWGKQTTTIVSELSIPEYFSDDEEWYEHHPNLYPRDLHLAQLRKRLFGSAK